MVHDDLDRHSTTPHASLAFRLVRRCCQAPVSPLPIDWQRRRQSVPPGTATRLITTSQDFQLADATDVGYFELRVPHSKSDSFNRIGNSKLLLGMRFWADAHLKFGVRPFQCSCDPEQVTQIGMAPFVERP